MLYLFWVLNQNGDGTYFGYRWKVGLFLAISIKRSRRGLPIDVAEHTAGLCQKIPPIPPFWYLTQNRHSIRQNGGLGFTLFDFQSSKCLNVAVILTWMSVNLIKVNLSLRTPLFLLQKTKPKKYLLRFCESS